MTEPLTTCLNSFLKYVWSRENGKALEGIKERRDKVIEISTYLRKCFFRE